jgi:polar amino acid transport system substrate-binding protein
MRLRYLLLCISFITVINTPANALTLGVETTDYSPYYYLNADQKYQGAARDIFDLFSKSHNLPISYSPMPVPRLFNEFVKGSIDLKFPDNPLWSASLHSKVKVFYSNSIFNIKESLLVLKKNSDIAKKDIKTVGTILGFSTPGIAKPVANKEFETVKTKEVEQLMHMLASERVQAMYFNESVALAVAKRLYPDTQLVEHSLYQPFQYAYHLSSIKHPELINTFNAFLISHAEQVADICNRYGLK